MSKFVKGTISYTAFKLNKEMGMISDMRERIELTSFKPLAPEDIRDESSGWVDPELSFDNELFANITLGDAILLAMRIDKYSFGASQMRPYLEKAEFDFMHNNSLERLTAQQKKDIKEGVIKSLKTNSLPKVTIVESFWSQESNRVYLFSQSGAVIAKFIDLFEQTFEITLDPISIMDAVDQLDNPNSMEPVFAKIWEL